MTGEFYFVFICFIAGAILLIGPFVLIGIIAGVLSLIERIRK